MPPRIGGQGASNSPQNWGAGGDGFPVAYREYQRLVSLPLYPRMSNQDVEDVVEAVVDVARKYRR